MLFKQILLDRSLHLPFKQHLVQATNLTKASAYLLELRAVVRVCKMSPSWKLFLLTLYSYTFMAEVVLHNFHTFQAIPDFTHVVAADVQKSVSLYVEAVQVIGCVDTVKTRTFQLPDDAFKTHTNSVTLKNVPDMDMSSGLLMWIMLVLCLFLVDLLA